MKFGSIYVVKNIVNGKYYVGQTCLDIVDRFWHHFNRGYVFHRALNKYGPENFILEVLHVVPQHLLTQVEHEYVWKYKSLVPFGYNILHPNQEYSDQTRNKISKSRLGRFTGKDNPFYGRTHTAESRLKMAARRPTKLTEKWKQALSAARIGHSVSEETRQKISQANTGKVRTQEMRDRVSKSKLGRKQSEATKLKRAAANRGQNRTPEFASLMKLQGQQQVSDEQIQRLHKIRQYFQDGLTNTEISGLVQLSSQMIGKIRSGKRWAWVS